MKAFDHQMRTELQDNIVSLAMGCPVDHCNPEDCPLFKVRQLDLPARLQWFRNLSDDDLQYLNSYHFVCLKLKLEARIASLCR